MAMQPADNISIARHMTIYGFVLAGMLVGGVVGLTLGGSLFSIMMLSFLGMLLAVGCLVLRRGLQPLIAKLVVHQKWCPVCKAAEQEAMHHAALEAGFKIVGAEDKKEAACQNLRAMQQDYADIVALEASISPEFRAFLGRLAVENALVVERESKVQWLKRPTHDEPQAKQ